MFFDLHHAAVRLFGRWHVGEKTAVTTQVGSGITIAFEGEEILLRFCMQGNEAPFPHVWLSVDNGARFEAALDSTLRIGGLKNGAHIATVIFKSAQETQSRWKAPVAKVEFVGFSAENAGVLPKEERRVIEFVGDSITEGIAVAPYFENGCCNNDITATFGWLTAKALDMQPVFSAYGGVGVTACGCGGVPTAPEIYGYTLADSPMNVRADVVVINHGANDKNWKRTAEEYVGAYTHLLDTVRAHHPDAQIVVLSAFCEFLPQALAEGIDAYNRANNDNVRFVDSAGWVAPTPLHPLYDGHKAIAEQLTAALKNIL